MKDYEVDSDDKLLAFHTQKLLGATKAKKGKAKVFDSNNHDVNKPVLARDLLLSLFSGPASEPAAESASEPERERDADGFLIDITVAANIDEGDDDQEEDDGFREDDDAEYLFALDEMYEDALTNSKRDDRFLRSTLANRKAKIPARRYVRSRDHKRAEDHKAYIRDHFERRKENARLINTKILSLRPYRSVNGTVTYLDPSFTNYLPPGVTVDPSQRHLVQSGQHMHILPEHIRNAIMALQFKEVLTSNDYELLLMLDATVPPKTLSRRQVNMYPIVVVGAGDVRVEARCMICLGTYNTGDRLRRLTCKHEFHVDCIDAWLLHSSERCPLDNLNLT